MEKKTENESCSGAFSHGLKSQNLCKKNLHNTICEKKTVEDNFGFELVYSYTCTVLKLQNYDYNYLWDISIVLKPVEKNFVLELFTIQLEYDNN